MRYDKRDKCDKGLKYAVASVGMIIMIVFFLIIADELHTSKIVAIAIGSCSLIGYLIQVITEFGRGLSGKALVMCTVLSILPLCIVVMLGLTNENEGFLFLLMMGFVVVEFVLAIFYYNGRNQ